MHPQHLSRRHVILAAAASVLSVVTAASGQSDLVPLPEAAQRAGGHYVRHMRVGSWAIVPDLKSLVNFSDLVVIGDVVAATTVLSKDQTYIKTVATVSVIETLKSDMPRSLLTVIVTGGRMAFPNGTSAETKTDHGEPLRVGRRYALFVERAEKHQAPEFVVREERGGYIPVAGPQGVFELRADGVKSQGRAIDTVKTLHENESVSMFVTQVRQAAGVDPKGPAPKSK